MMTTKFRTLTSALAFVALTTVAAHGLMVNRASESARKATAANVISR